LFTKPTMMTQTVGMLLMVKSGGDYTISRWSWWGRPSCLL